MLTAAQFSSHAIFGTRINVRRNSSPEFFHVWSLKLQQRWKLVTFKALKDGAEGGTGDLAGQRWNPGLEIEVPFEQRPVNEYSSLKDGILYSWGELSPGSFFFRLGGLWFVTFIVLGGPIAAASFDPSKDPLRFALAAGTGTLLLVSLVVLRIYLGWSYVGNRLLSAVVPYEETGWYDGQMWVKPPEVLARDRLLGSYKVKPVIKLLKQTLVGTGVLLVTTISLFVFATPFEDLLHSGVSITRKQFNFKCQAEFKQRRAAEITS
ncbi:protein CONSERVED IN THE GREEN LINEAGE AND DIATOMS 27, chloroplastic isoform X1 [Dioscorea cayenensis subsp. rotundata]|uniref:Protein CONSERVED IN THE GREEN LINEAGE AND DIATOMS 27, chloroplastic isoform X1 n=1 Tax=Dioscorea cayennensis subsp. rotundata TaxID=55577 RepID=A0AB40AHC2_DIOCR|nr:protein CONSERVED IN THE GREEN LINEAGE AND DIATOMS 27, chloroplastic isoform X1 [Dioscorea cayenensis subsp. rotundata]